MAQIDTRSKSNDRDPVPKVRDVIPERALAPRYQRAAQHVAEDTLTDEEIAAECGISRRQLARWKLREDFRAAVGAIMTAYRDQVLSGGLCRREVRVAELHSQYRNLKTAIKERATAGASEGATGYLMKRDKIIGSGPNSKDTIEYEIDVATNKEMREVLDLIAVEVGQRVEKHAHSHKITFETMTKSELEDYAETGKLPARLHAQTGDKRPFGDHDNA
jgi:hypothetical protein